VEWLKVKALNSSPSTTKKKKKKKAGSEWTFGETGLKAELRLHPKSFQENQESEGVDLKEGELSTHYHKLCHLPLPYFCQINLYSWPQ
jgi:hypothetical protein